MLCGVSSRRQQYYILMSITYDSAVKSKKQIRHFTNNLKKYGRLLRNCRKRKANLQIFISPTLFYLFCFVLFQQFVRRQNPHGCSVSRGEPDVCNKALLKFGSVAAVVDTRLPLMMG